MVIVASLIIAACSLAVNVTAGLGERKRPFSLLRLTGVPLGTLRRVITLESALPLFVVAGVSLVVGLVAAALYLSSQVGHIVPDPRNHLLGGRDRWSGGFTRHRRLDVPTAQPDHRPRRSTERVNDDPVVASGWCSGSHSKRVGPIDAPVEDRPQSGGGDAEELRIGSDRAVVNGIELRL